MAIITLIIGTDCEIYGYSTKQRGYGRQSLYVEIKRTDIPFDLNKSFIKDIYLMDVYPNVQEHFDFLLEDDSFFDEEKGYYTDGSGNGEYEEIYNTTTEALNAHLEGIEVEVEVEDVYVISWDENTFITKYIADGFPNGTTILENATQFDSEDEAQDFINENNWSNCYVTTLN